MPKPGWTLHKALNPDSKSLAVNVVEGVPGQAGTNASGTVTWTGDFPTQVVKTVNGATYTKSYTWSGGGLIAWTSWS